jgi:transposase
LQADAFTGYNAIYEGGDAREAACMAHARRKFHDLFVARRNEVNTEALRRIGELHAIEAAIRGKPPDQRRRVRQEQVRPRLDAFEIRVPESRYCQSRQLCAESMGSAYAVRR